MIEPNPECRDGKHKNCDGVGWDMDQDEPCKCPCQCHVRLRIIADYRKSVDLFQFGKMTVSVGSMKILLDYIEELERGRESK
jgi:hypothetical protein